MEIKKFEINDNEYTFVSNIWDRKNSWGHEVTLFKNNTEIGSASITYLNRTWERYTYQSVMQKVVDHLLTAMEENFISGYKEIFEIKRLTKQKRRSVIDTFEQLIEVQELRELYNQL
jgi:hypothetical protein